jgi:hypothetical protein
MRLSQVQTVPIDQVKPYWRNPRRVTDEAVNMLRVSIERFGYQQPIVVDEAFVIIVGHTRYAALRKMGETEIQVMVVDDLSPQEVKQYRVIDNRSGEFSSWNYDNLMSELQDADRELTKSFFPEIDFGDEMIAADFSQEFAQDEKQAQWDKVDGTVEFVCPACFHGWEQEVARDDLMTGRLADG